MHDSQEAEAIQVYASIDGWMDELCTGKQWTITQLKKEKGYSDIRYNMDERHYAK